MSAAKKPSVAQASSTTPKSTPKTYPLHRVTNLFPSIDQPALAELTESIKTGGLREPIKLVQGHVIDGRARLQACNDAGVEPRFEELQIDEKQVLGVVVDFNLRRRHLTPSQRAIVAAKMVNYSVGDNQHTSNTVSQGDAATAMSVSVDTLQRAQNVQKHGVPELNAAMEAGQVDVTNASAIATLPPSAQTLVVAQGAKQIIAVAKQLNRERKEEKRSENVKKIEDLRKKSVPLSQTGKRYEVIVADPAWDYLGKDQTPYPTMPLKDICGMPVADRAAENSVLFLWASASLVKEAMQTIASWGFNFKTTAVWRKGESGLGSYFRVNHELLFIATRGELPAVKETFASCFDAPRQDHSRKPAIVFDMINKMYPELTKLELFCRGKPQPGWDGWGNECEGSIDMPVAAAPVDAANDSKVGDIGDELLTAVGLTIENPAPVRLKRAA